MEKIHDVIIIGGSYSGLSAAMALGRSLRNVLVLDADKPCNSQTPHSHNFLTQDGETPLAIRTKAKTQVLNYPTVCFVDDLAIKAVKTDLGFVITTQQGKSFTAKKILLATGVKDIFPAINGFSTCWGITVLHCPYCHGYEVSDKPLGIIANGEMAFEFCKLISNWTKDLTLFTNGASTLSADQALFLEKKHIQVIDKKIEKLVNKHGILEYILFTDGSKHHLKALFARGTFEHHTTIANDLGCKLNEHGYIVVNEFQETSTYGIYAAGDCTTAMRSVAFSVSSGNYAGVVVNKQLTEEDFLNL